MFRLKPEELAVVTQLHNRTNSGEAVTALRAWLPKHSEEIDAAQGEKNQNPASASSS
jgi:hypothetical protein